MKRIALLGPGTFTEESAHSFLGSGETYEYVNCKLIDDVFMSTVNGETDYSVIPIENTFDGSVRLHLDWLIHEVDLPMQAEWVFPISINLLGIGAGKGNLEASCSGLTKIISHGVTLTQCRQFLRKYLPHVELEQVGSNGEAARLVSELGRPDVAALAPNGAGMLYGLHTWAPAVQDHQNNYTRFLLVGNEPIQLPGRAPDFTKTTIIVTLPDDYPGGLHQLLSAFAWRRINLSKIESRPTKKKLGTYYFYIDVEASMDSVLLPAALQEIEAIGCQVRLLGCYPTYSYEPVHSEV
ncbi:prephenate dehydratase [Paenibacillus rigui]|uniref:Prephenate dehydratase n=1 Tax=Paenibacillus rigui TaxID=554312 RepID=A0A229UUJ6_9BACL|nr:prephenate dehydratase [Paenibacillus rigui]OXM86835.1 prephenate dehydratase [Paenibacillus rigui]